MWAWFLVQWLEGGASACAVPVSPLRVSQQATSVEDAYRSLVDASDEDAAFAAVRERAEALRAALPCVVEPLAPRSVARIHQVLGLHHYAARELVVAEQAFAAARRADPALELGTGWLVEGAPERRAYGRLSVPPPAPVPPPRAAVLRWDGVAGMQRPVEGPSLLQIVERGRVRTTYLHAGEPLPAYGRRAPQAAWVVLGVGAGVAAVGLASGAAALGTYQAACARQPEQVCAGWGERTPAEVGATIERAAAAGAVLLGLGAAAGVAGGVWIGVAQRPGGGTLRVGGTW